MENTEQNHWEVQILEIHSVKNAEPEAVADMLNDGWELFSHAVFADNSEHLYFKRLIK